MAGGVVEHLRGEFLEYLEKERGYSLHTIRAYRIDLDSYLGFLKETKRGGKNREDVIAFIASLVDRGRDRRTISRHLSTLRSFFKYLIKKKEMDKNPTLMIKAPKLKKKLPTFLTIEAINEVLLIPSSKRDRAILELLYSCGLRASELVNLDLSDIDFGEEVVRVIGKRNQERIIPIGRAAVKAITAYLNERPQVDDPALFLNRFGGRLSTRSLQNIVRKYLLRVATASGTNPHIIRHSFATHLLSRGADLKSVQELLGHTTISATQVYTHVSIDQLIKEYMKSHPRAE